MINLSNNNIVIGSYSGGVVAPSVFHYHDQNLQPVLSQINPSFVLRHDGYYYVSAEHPDGTVSTLDKDFKLLSKVKTMGDDPCHLTTDDFGRYLVATNYSSATLIVYKLTDHIPSAVHALITHESTPEIPSHPHTTVWSEDNTKLFCADLGTCWVYYYSVTPESVTWQKQKSIYIQKAGPRTQTRGKPGSKLIYLSCELDSTIRVLSYNGPGLEQLAAYNLYTSGTNFPSEVKYFREQVYVAVRGEDCIVVFDVKGGKLEERGSFKVGEWPRHFEISVHGEVFVSCQRGNLVQKFQITPKSIIPISQMKIVTPSCVVIL